MICFFAFLISKFRNVINTLPLRFTDSHIVIKVEARSNATDFRFFSIVTRIICQLMNIICVVIFCSDNMRILYKIISARIDNIINWTRKRKKKLNLERVKNVWIPKNPKKKNLVSQSRGQNRKGEIILLNISWFSKTDLDTIIKFSRAVDFKEHLRNIKL